MSVEVYAIVVFDVTPPMTKEELEYMEREGYTNDEIKYEAYGDRVVEYHFCKCRLVQSERRKKEGSPVPVPKWEVVQKLRKLSNEQFERLFTKTDAEGLTWEQYREKLALNFLGRESEIPILITNKGAIDDKRVQLKQIRFLYPETAKMPLAIALDYVRDKL